MSFGNPILGGQSSLIRQAIQSPNYSAGLAGWNLSKDGSAEFNNVTIRGSIAQGTPPGLVVAVNSINGFFVAYGGGSQPNYFQATAAPSLVTTNYRPNGPVQGGYDNGGLEASCEFDTVFPSNSRRGKIVLKPPGTFSSITPTLTMVSQSADGSTLAAQTTITELVECTQRLLLSRAASTALEIPTANAIIGGNLQVGSISSTGTLSTSGNLLATGNVTSSAGQLRGAQPNGKVALATATAAIPLTTVTAIAYSGTDIRDVAGQHDPVTNNTRVTPNLAGVYRVTLCTSWAAGTATNRQTFGRKNGTTIFGPTMNETAPTTAFQQFVSGTVVMNGTTDFFEHCVSSGVAVNVTGTAGANDTTNPNTTMEWEYISST